MSAAPSPCRACPWRTSNQGKRHPDGWYTKANLTRLWAGMRRGESMSCHPTDPANVVSQRAEQAGYRPAPDAAEVRECVGAQILQQRELMRLQDQPSLKAYRAASPRGLTTAGIGALLNRVIFGGVFGGPVMSRPNLNDPDVSLPWLTWTPR